MPQERQTAAFFLPKILERDTPQEWVSEGDTGTQGMSSSVLCRRQGSEHEPNRTRPSRTMNTRGLLLSTSKRRSVGHTGGLTRRAVGLFGLSGQPVKNHEKISTQCCCCARVPQASVSP